MSKLILKDEDKYELVSFEKREKSILLKVKGGHSFGN